MPSSSSALRLVPLSEIEAERHVLCDLVQDELRANGEEPWSGLSTMADFDGMRRCVCCYCLIVPGVTGSYDRETCLACGCAQEESEAEYDRVSAERRENLRSLYARTRGKNRDGKRARLALDRLAFHGLEGRFFEGLFPAYRVRMIRADYADLGL